MAINILYLLIHVFGLSKAGCKEWRGGEGIKKSLPFYVKLVVLNLEGMCFGM